MRHEPSETIFTACDVTKSFPGVQALCGVSFDLKAGEVHALVGENGAGKSTLAQIIAGVQSADSGEMSLHSRPYLPKSRIDAEEYGVRMVMQELNLISNLSVAENIFIDRLPSRFGFIDYKKLNSSAKEVMKQVGLEDIESDLPVGLLGIGQQQMVEIAAGLSRYCRILALDEPTASLTDREVELLFTQIKRLTDEGVGIIYISHRIDEVLEVADRVTVLRDGKVVSTDPAKSLAAGQVIQMMVGRDLEHEQIRPISRPGPTVMRVSGLTIGEKVRDVSFEVHCGEILGFAGLMGSGRSEIMRAIFGADPADNGEIFLHGESKPTEIRTPRDAVRNGIALLTEDRKEQGLLLSLTVRENISLTRLGDLSRFGWLDRKRERSTAGEFIERLNVRCSSSEQSVGQLSGGNQQKVVIAKWIYRDCDILIFDEPTRGIDVGAKFEIYRMLGELAGRQKAIIFVSSDLKELMAVCDRIVVVSAGRIAAQFEPDQWSEEKIMAAAFSEYTAV